MEVNKLRELMSKATALPWQCEWNWELRRSVYFAWAQSQVIEDENSLSKVAQRAQADRDYMEAACNSIPALLDELDTLRAKNHRVHDLFGKVTRAISDAQEKYESGENTSLAYLLEKLREIVNE